MTNITMETLKRHKSAMGCTKFRLDYQNDPGTLPRSDMMWRCLWAYAVNQVKKRLVSSKVRSDVSKRGHKTRVEKNLGKGVGGRQKSSEG